MRRCLLVLTILVFPLFVQAQDQVVPRPAADAAAICPNVDPAIQGAPENVNLSNPNQALKFGDHAKKKVGTCSGVDCGCDIDQANCYADCPPEGEEGATECRLACVRAYRTCAICCCDPGNWRCGG